MLCFSVPLPTYVYIVVPVVIILALIGCCCCVKKCCCKKCCSKGSEPALAVQHQVSISSSGLDLHAGAGIFISIFPLQDRTQPSVTYSVEPAARPPTYQPVRPVAPAAYSPGHSVGFLWALGMTEATLCHFLISRLHLIAFCVIERLSWRLVVVLV